MDIVKYIRARAAEIGTQKALADKLGISDAYLSDVLNGRKEPGAAILDPLDLERVVTYRRKRAVSRPSASE